MVLHRPAASSLLLCAGKRLSSSTCPARLTPFAVAEALTADPSSGVSVSSRPAPPHAVAVRTMSSSHRLKGLHEGNINAQVKEAKYAVRGELAVRAEAYRAKLAKVSGAPPSPPEESLPFDTVIHANIGNPQQLDQKPITFFRQVLSLLEHPPLMDKPEVLTEHLGYKQDAIDRARWLLKECQSVGAYSHSQGVPAIRESVARFIEQRDQHPADPSNIFLTAGASAGVSTLLQVICSHPEVGVMVPIPQYPLYTATLSLLNARCVPYYLDESREWQCSISDIRKSYHDAIANGTEVRAIVIINPGNPTGASLPEEDIEAVIDFAAEHKLVIIADEVYQTNIFRGTFHSFKRALRNMQQKHPEPRGAAHPHGRYDHVELCSLHSVSKGMVGECGHRGGYFELIGFDPAVQDHIYKLVSISLCPPVVGQALVELMVNPPSPGSPSHAQYAQEYATIADGLRARATALHGAFVRMRGVACAPPQGSMYLFPTITLPPRAVEAARKDGRQPDEFYCLRLLEATGVCVVPGSGFGQREGSWHFRTTFLAPGTDWVERIVKFHEEFMDEFGG